MVVVAVIGTQWGDEGKGKVSAFYGSNTSVRYIARGTGGNNAGHTFYHRGKEYKFNLTPCAPFSGKSLALGRCMVVDPAVLAKEVELIKKETREYPDLRIDGSLSMILDWHKIRDGISTMSKKKDIGTTKRGIGPAYEDRCNRLNDITYNDFHDAHRFEERVKDVFGREKRIIGAYGGAIRHHTDTLDRATDAWNTLQRYEPRDISLEIHAAIKDGDSVLLEGAQGFGLDKDHGTRPDVTSSNPGILGLLNGVGAGPHDVNAVVGVVKAYTTRVGGGPMPTLQGKRFNATIDRDKRGSERGATTGRKRRSGWLDMPMLRHAVRKNNIEHLAITKVDVLDNFSEVKVCTEYKIDDRVLEEPPNDITLLPRAKPAYQKFKGWKKTNWKRVSRTGDLPRNLNNYLKYIEEDTGAEVCLVSCGPQPEMTLEIYDVFDL